jgi:hypothetical protein
MCEDEGRLLAYLDGEVSEPERAEIESHVSGCRECEAALARLKVDRDAAAGALERLQPAAQVVEMPARRPSAAPVARRFSRSRIAAAVAAALVVASFALPPVQNAAASLLQVFRVQKVQTVTLSQTDLNSISTALQKGGHVDLQSFGDAWIDGASSSPTSVTVAQAQAALDFPVKLPSSESAQPALLLTHAQTYRFRLHIAAINDALASYGGDAKLPTALDGKVFTVNIPATLVARYPVPAGTNTAGWPDRTSGVYVGQARSPELTVPDGVDAAQLRTALLDLPFIPQTVRDQLAAIKDWQSTLIIPNVDGTARDVSIDGVPAVVVTPKSAARDVRGKLAPLPDSSTIIWNDNGVVRAVGGPIDENAALGLARSTMK